MHTEPASPPQDVRSTVLLSTEIRVSWEDVPPIDQNGVITTYEVQYEPLMTFDGQISTARINTTNSSIVLMNLEEYVEYNITVRAFTSVGAGPFSDPVVNRTFENGKCFLILIFIMYKLLACIVYLQYQHLHQAMLQLMQIHQLQF